MSADFHTTGQGSRFLIHCFKTFSMGRGSYHYVNEKSFQRGAIDKMRGGAPNVKSVQIHDWG